MVNIVVVEEIVIIQFASLEIIIYPKWHLLLGPSLGKSIYSTMKGNHLFLYKDKIFCKLFVTGL